MTGMTDKGYFAVNPHVNVFLELIGKNGSIHHKHHTRMLPPTKKHPPIRPRGGQPCCNLTVVGITKQA